jgi:hypothetical protein
MPHFMRKWGCFMQKTVTRRDEEGYTGDGSRQVKAFHKQVFFALFRPSSSLFIAKKRKNVA